MKINYNGLTGLYTKVTQVNVKNEHQQTTDDEGTITELTTRPMDVVLKTFTDEAKTNKVHTIELTNAPYDPEAADKDPVNQGYVYAKTQLDVVKDNL